MLSGLYCQFQEPASVFLTFEFSYRLTECCNLRKQMLSKVLKKRDIVTILYASCTFKMLMLLYILESQKYIAEKHETFSIFAKFETL